MDAVFEQAMLDFYHQQQRGELLIHNTYGVPDEMPLEVYFRSEKELNNLELYALELCAGRVLDVGAGAGAVSLVLQSRNSAVVSLEISRVFCNIMKELGVKNILNGDFLKQRPNEQYDTLLMLMNGFGFCGSIDRLPDLFKAIDRHLKPGGQVIFDSSDISYLYKEGKPTDYYFGEMSYQYEYKGIKGPWFKWLYIDANTFSAEADKYGFAMQLLMTEETGQYLGRLVRFKD